MQGGQLQLLVQGVADGHVPTARWRSARRLSDSNRREQQRQGTCSAAILLACLPTARWHSACCLLAVNNNDYVTDRSRAA